MEPDKKPVFRTRLVPRHDTPPIKFSISGRTKAPFSDLYAEVLGAKWHQVAVSFVVFFLIINGLYAGLYFAFAHMGLGNSITGARPHVFEDYFFFSVQTLATIGYGGMVPHGFLINALVTIEAISGLGIYALLTGIIYSRFSRPTARVTFSDIAVVNLALGERHLSLRMVNDRGNRIVDTKASLMMLRDEHLPDGSRMRRFHDLELMRSAVPIMQLSWSLFHKIDEHSPLFGETAESLREQNVEIIVSITGMDETLSSIIHSRYSYVADDIIFDGVFEDILERRPDGLHMHYDRLHRVKENT